MPGRIQDEALRWLLQEERVPVVHDRFRGAGTNARGVGKIACTLCGMEGYGSTDPLREGQWAVAWQLEHLLPHNYVCSCGMAFTNAPRWAAHLHKERHVPHGDSLRG